MGDCHVNMAEEEPASPATRLFHSSKLNSFIIAIVGLKEKLDIEHTKKVGFNDILLNFPRFTSVMVKDDKHGMRWIPKKVIMEDHIIGLDLDDYDTKSGDKFLEEYIAGLTGNPMDLSKPLWEAHLLNVKTSDANAIVVFRIHHSLGDGISLISGLVKCLRKSSDPESLPTIPSKNSKSAITINPIRHCFYAIWSIVMLIINTLVDITVFFATFLFLKDTETPIKGGPGTERTQKRIMHRTVSLNDIKLIKTAMNVTINDVVLGVTEAGLSRYLNRRYSNKHECNKVLDKKNYLPKNIRLRASVLINLRPSPRLQVLGDMTNKKSKEKWGNQIGCCFLPLRIGLRDDPLLHIREAHNTIKKKKLSLGPRFSYALNNLLFKLLGEKVGANVVYRMLFNITICFSNVIGPKEESTLYGNPVSYIAPSVHGLPYALLIHYQSYADKMTIVLTYDPTLILNPQQLCDDLEDSLNIIKNTILQRGLVKDAQP